MRTLGGDPNDGLLEHRAYSKTLDYTDIRIAVREMRTITDEKVLDASGQRSVDAFVTLRHKDFLSMGKLVIAHVLIQHEEEPKLFGRRGDDNWYPDLLVVFESSLRHSSSTRPGD